MIAILTQGPPYDVPGSRGVANERKDRASRNLMFYGRKAEPVEGGPATFCFRI
jgi:hypothetical protein